MAGVTTGLNRSDKASTWRNITRSPWWGPVPRLFRREQPGVGA